MRTDNKSKELFLNIVNSLELVLRVLRSEPGPIFEKGWAGLGMLRVRPKYILTCGGMQIDWFGDRFGFGECEVEEGIGGFNQWWKKNRKLIAKRVENELAEKNGKREIIHREFDGGFERSLQSGILGRCWNFSLLSMD